MGILFITMVLAALGLFLGMANPFMQIPLLSLLYPAGLALLGFRARNRMQALRLGWLTGIMGATGVLYWVAVPVQQFGGLPWPLAAACAMAIAAYVGLYGGLFAVAAHEYREGNVWLRAILLGVVWYLLEWLRGWLLTGFPWMPLVAAFVPWPEAIQGAALLGAYGMGGVLAAKAVLFSISLQERKLHPAMLSVLMLGLMLAGGEWRLSRPAPAGPAVDILLVQGNVDQNVKWVPERQKATVERYLQLTEGSLRRIDHGDDTPTLVIWPETSMPFDFETSAFTALVRNTLARQKVWLITGSVGMDTTSNKYLNRAYAVAPDNTPLNWYEKEHLLPFGEYVPPGLDFAFLDGFFQGVGEFVPGRRTGPLRIGGADKSGLVSGVLICYEVTFPELARKHAANGATLLVNISNDAWFGKTSAPEQHLQLSVLRAVEQGLPLVRSSNTGISAFVDSRGQILERGGLFRAETLSRHLVLGKEFTVFYLLAPFLPGLGLVLGLALAYALFISEQKRPLRTRLRL